MRTLLMSAKWLIGLAALLAPVGAASAASNGVRDSAHFFSPDAIRQAEQTIRQIEQRHQRDVLVETLPAIPDELHDQYAQQGKETFFSNWAKERARTQGVDGIYILIVKDPGHLEIWDGNKTQQRLFNLSAEQHLKNQLLTAFRNKQYDPGLVQATKFIEQQMDENVPASGGGATAAQPNTPGFPVQTPVQRPGWGMGSIACVIIGAVLLILLFRGVFGRSGSSYGGGYYPPGGYPQGGAYPPGAYPPGAYGGGGGGMGRGFLGGLLGGALGGYAADRWLNHGQGGGYVAPPAGGDFSGGADTGGTTTGGDFGSSDASSGGDFGGGGGGDFGGGGDAGGSSGGDF